jgi:hypothetical protein
MRHILKRSWLFLALFYFANLFGTSMVYNFRIAQVTKQPISEEPNNRKHTVLGLLFDLYQKKYNNLHQNFTGGMASYMHDFAPYYVRLDFAMSHIKQSENHITNFTANQTDDLLLTTGFKLTHNERRTITISALCGVPTHRLKILQQPNFGYSQVGLGLQLDGLHNFNTQSAFIYGTRYLYFIPRTAHDASHNKYKFSVSNVFDALVAGKTNWGPQGLEAGYTARFQFGAQIYPNFEDILEKSNYIRSSWYLIYKYKFFTTHSAQRLLLNLGYGFDHKSKVFGNKDIITLWGSWSVNF